MSGVTSARWLMPCQRGASGRSVVTSRSGVRSSAVMGPMVCPPRFVPLRIGYRARTRSTAKGDRVMDIYAFRADVYVPALPDLTGFDVEATDGHIGKIDEATMKEDAACLVVDTGFWIFGKKRMLPAGVVK